MIHAPYVLTYSLELERELRPEAQIVLDNYTNGRGRSVFTPTLDRILRGLIAQRLLALDLGRPEADVTRPWAKPYDIAPDIEVRSVLRPSRIDHWTDVCLPFYRKDKGKIDRRWVLAMIDPEIREVRYLGWATGAEMLFPEPVTASRRNGETYEILGMVYPDQMRAMADLE